MKKTFVNIILLASATIALANNVSAATDYVPGEPLKNDADTLAYALCVGQADGMKAALKQSKLDSAYIDDFYKGLIESATMDANDAKKKAYLLGLQFGQVISERMVPGVSREVYGNESTEKIPVNSLLDGLMAGLKKDQTLMTVEQAQSVFESKSKALKMKQYQANIDAGKAYMATFAKQKKVKKLPCGVLYREIVANKKGEIPTDSSKVKVHYEGKTVDGHVFDSSYKRGEPTTFGLKQVIKGWTEVLKVMPVGSKWEVVIPQELAYGERNTGEIKPYSTLVFTIELIEIVKEEKES